jgi:hypothetical protein
VVPTYPVVQHRIPEDLGIYSLIISFEWDYFHPHSCNENFKNILLNVFARIVNTDTCSLFSTGFQFKAQAEEWTS